MDGDIIAFDDDAQSGVIATLDGQHYPFSLTDWRGRGLPGPGIAVRFDVREACAVQVFNRPEPQRRAMPASSPPPHAANGKRRRSRHSHWAIAAVVIAMFSLFFDRAAPLLGVVAALCAMLGLRQIRREPDRYRGRGFCWAAIVLALVIATLSLLVEPASEPRVSQSHHHVMPDGASPRATSQAAA